MTSSNVYQLGRPVFAAAVLALACFAGAGCVNPEVRCSDEPTAPDCARDGGSIDADTRVDGGEADAAPDAAPSDGGDAAAGDAGPCDGGCPDGQRCVDGRCVECTAATAATDCDDPKPYCSDDGACVGCRDDGDCGENTPICDAETRTCRGCSANPECAAQTETPTCHEESGACVACTYDDEDHCDANVCDVLARTCTTDTEANSAGACDACVSDRQCEEGLLCVPQYFMGALVGHFCAWRRDAVEDELCSNVPPYGTIQTPPRASLGNVTTDVCVLRNSTCEAHADFSSQGCMTGTTLTDPVPDATCGATDHDDGYCAPRGGNPNQCTVGCTTFSDCPCSAPFCASQYQCEDNFCSFTTTCVVDTGICT